MAGLELGIELDCKSAVDCITDKITYEIENNQ